MSDGGLSDTERQLYVGVAVVVAALLALIWLAGALAGALFGSGWTPIGTGDLGATALRLPSHLSEPRDAWPREARSALPGAVGFYVSTALVAGLIAAAALLLRRASCRWPCHSSAAIGDGCPPPAGQPCAISPCCASVSRNPVASRSAGTDAPCSPPRSASR